MAGLVVLPIIAQYLAWTRRSTFVKAVFELNMLDQPPAKRLKEGELSKEEEAEYEVVQAVVKEELEDSLNLGFTQVWAVCCHHGFPEDLTPIQLSDALIAKSKGQPYVPREPVSTFNVFQVRSQGFWILGSSRL